MPMYNRETRRTIVHVKTQEAHTRKISNVHRAAAQLINSFPTLLQVVVVVVHGKRRVRFACNRDCFCLHIWRRQSFLCILCLCDYLRSSSADNWSPSSWPILFMP